MDDPSELDALRREVSRLRALVGDDEVGYEALRDDVERASADLRVAEEAVGELRGTIAEMQTQLQRARQDQERYQQVFDAARHVGNRRRWARQKFVSLRRRIG